MHAQPRIGWSAVRDDVRAWKHDRQAGHAEAARCRYRRDKTAYYREHFARALNHRAFLVEDKLFPFPHIYQTRVIWPETVAALAIDMGKWEQLVLYEKGAM